MIPVRAIPALMAAAVGLAVMAVTALMAMMVVEMRVLRIRTPTASMVSKGLRLIAIWV